MDKLTFGPEILVAYSLAKNVFCSDALLVATTTAATYFISKQFFNFKKCFHFESFKLMRSKWYRMKHIDFYANWLSVFMEWNAIRLLWKIHKKNLDMCIFKRSSRLRQHSKKCKTIYCWEIRTTSNESLRLRTPKFMQYIQIAQQWKSTNVDAFLHFSFLNDSNFIALTVEQQFENELSRCVILNCSKLQTKTWFFGIFKLVHRIM